MQLDQILNSHYCLDRKWNVSFQADAFAIFAIFCQPAKAFAALFYTIHIIIYFCIPRSGYLPARRTGYSFAKLIIISIFKSYSFAATAVARNFRPARTTINETSARVGARERNKRLGRANI